MKIKSKGTLVFFVPFRSVIPLQLRQTNNNISEWGKEKGVWHKPQNLPTINQNNENPFKSPIDTREIAH